MGRRQPPLNDSHSGAKAKNPRGLGTASPCRESVFRYALAGLNHFSASLKISDMSRFTSQQEAKEFLVAQIVLQAQRDGVSLTEVERKMLYFSETDWTLSDISEVNEVFEREYDQDEYEKKISRVIREALKRARKESKESGDSWSDAVRLLRKGDHYLLVMMDAAGA